MVLELLHEHKLHEKENKSFFRYTSIHYLGSIVDTQGMCLDPSRVKDLAQWKTPSNAHDLKSFMGGINFYWKFVSHLPQLAHPLHQLSHQTNFVSTPEDERHFMKLKTTLCSTLDLRMSNMNHPFDIETNASQFAIRVLLKQGGHLVVYHSETLDKGKGNYNTYEKEFYNLVKELKQWCHYILGKEIILHTDNHR